MTDADLQFIISGKPTEERQIAVRHSVGGNTESGGEINSDKTGVFWLSGFKSDMNGSKAVALADYAITENLRCTRFDYSGHGLSSGAFEDACVSDWLEQALAVFDRFCSGPTVVIGSSMGGWIAMLLALARRKGKAIKGIVLIAPAVDFTEELMWKQRFSDAIRETILRDGRWEQPSEYSDDPYVITKKLIEDGRKHLILDKLLATGCPVTILQGAQDPDVPWQHAQRLAEALPDDDVTFSLVPDGDHRLSRPQDIDLMLRSVKALL